MGEPLNCPFCGEKTLAFQEGSTCRWVVAVCGSCEAQGPPERKEVMAGPVTAADEAVALESWNRRPSPSPSPRERRLAESLLAVTANQVVGSSYTETVAEARAILASPEPTEPEAPRWSIEFGQEPAHPGGQQVGIRDAEARLFLEGFPEPMVVRQRSMVKTKRFAEALASALRLPLKGSGG